MIFLDTNILVYATVNQDAAKQKISENIVSENIGGNLVISPLILSEYVYVMAKLGIDESYVRKSVDLFRKCVYSNIDVELVYSSFLLGQKIKMNKNINDLMHLKYAEKYAKVIYTFDDNFKKLAKHSSIDIKILK
jgi:predicted nucleic acid-binding protein